MMMRQHLEQKEKHVYIYRWHGIFFKLVAESSQAFQMIEFSLDFVYVTSQERLVYILLLVLLLLSYLISECLRENSIYEQEEKKELFCSFR
jgi:hypothetical protein